MKPLASTSQHDQVIGAHEAQNRMSELLRQVDAGQSFTIKVQERPVARLIPVAADAADTAQAVADMQAFMRRQKNTIPAMSAAEFDELRRADQR
ncbi:MAG: type II toxin-antitoxin system prevent-host-death family antitoxin [Lautropia sp.]|nr:type II toxin-antitoxin system prevent-host-death family antitoxin [Lautropia sp.]